MDGRPIKPENEKVSIKIQVGFTQTEYDRLKTYCGYMPVSTTIKAILKDKGVI